MLYEHFMCFHQQWQPFCENLIGLIFSKLFLRAVFKLDFSGFLQVYMTGESLLNLSQRLSSPPHESNLAFLLSRMMKNIFCIITKEAFSNVWMHTDIFVYNIFRLNNARSSVGQIKFVNSEV